MMCDRPKQITLHIFPPLAKITIKSRSGVNILHTELLRSFREALKELNERRNVSVVILCSGSGEGFAAGADMMELRNLSCQTSIEFSSLGQRIFSEMNEMTLIFIAVVDGYCIGGGFDLALACDIVVASDNSYFQHPGMMRGFITGFGGNNRLRRSAGPRRSTEALIFGEKINAERSQMCGVSMRNERFPSTQSFAYSLAERISLLSQEQIELIKRSTKPARGASFPQRAFSESRLSFLLSLRS